MESTLNDQLSQFYVTYGPAVLRRCRTMLRDEERAVDAMHDVFVKLARTQGPIDPAKVGGLLYCMATQVCLNTLRSQSRRPETHDDGLLARIANADDPERRSAARLLLGRLFEHNEPSTRTIAVLHLLDGMTLQEVADEVGMSVSGIRKRLRKLKAQITELEGI